MLEFQLAFSQMAKTEWMSLRELERKTKFLNISLSLCVDSSIVCARLFL